MISIKNIRIRENWVLIKPDPDFESYQFGGKETGIIAPTYKYEKGNRVDAKNKNFATTGTVYGVPERIRFTRDDIRNIKASIITERNNEKVIADSSLLYKINRLKENGCRFETENELTIGDHVKFSYQIHLKAQYFDTEEGRMCFVKYDDIYMTTAGKMINGFILVDPELQDTKLEDGIKTKEVAGLSIVKLGDTYKRSARWAYGTVLHSGKKIKGYFDFATYCDDDIDVQAGDKIIYDPRVAVQYETESHMALADRKLLLIQRKDILFMEKETPNFRDLCTI